jgi:hypothetical protein
MVDARGRAGVSAGLREIVADYESRGVDLTTDPRLAEAILLDSFPEAPAEIRALVEAIRCGAIQYMRDRSGQGAEFSIQGSASQLTESAGLREDLARWSVESWWNALALGQPVRPGGGVGEAGAVAAGAGAGAAAGAGVAATVLPGAPPPMAPPGPAIAQPGPPIAPPMQPPMAAPMPSPQSPPMPSPQAQPGPIVTPPIPGGQAVPPSHAATAAEEATVGPEPYPGSAQQYPGSAQQYPGGPQYPGSAQQYPGGPQYPTGQQGTPGAAGQPYAAGQAYQTGQQYPGQPPGQYPGQQYPPQYPPQGPGGPQAGKPRGKLIAIVAVIVVIVYAVAAAAAHLPPFAKSATSTTTTTTTTPGTTSTIPGTVTTNPTLAQQLFAAIPNTSSCQELTPAQIKTDELPAGVGAVYVCTPSSGPSVLYAIFTSRSAAGAAYNGIIARATTGLPKGDCSTTNRVQGSYNKKANPNVAIGSLACYTAQNTATSATNQYLLWWHYSDNIIAVANSATLGLSGMMAAWASLGPS